MNPFDKILFRLTGLDMFVIIIICLAVGFVVAVIILKERSKIKYTEYDKKPHKMSLVVGHRGSVPVYAVMYSKEFVVKLWGRLKGCQAKIEAMKQIGEEE